MPVSTQSRSGATCMPSEPAKCGCVGSWKIYVRRDVTRLRQRVHVAWEDESTGVDDTSHCLAQDDGAVKCWGRNYRGSLGGARGTMGNEPNGAHPATYAHSDHCSRQGRAVCRRLMGASLQKPLTRRAVLVQRWARTFLPSTSGLGGKLSPSPWAMHWHAPSW